MHHPFETPAHRRPVTDSARSARRAPRLLLATLGAGAAVTMAVSSPARAAAPTVELSTNASFGTILTDGAGFALYTLATDVNGKSSCTGSCAVVWPALIVPAGTTPSAGPGVPGVVGESLQGNGTYQVTYNGSPLYTFVSDTAPGQATGNHVAGFTVVVVSAAASPTTTTPPAAPTTTAGPSATSAATTAPPRSTPAPSTPTTASLAAPAVAPSAAAPPASSSASGSSAPSPVAAAATASPGTLAATGPGTGLVWMVVVGGALVAASLAMVMAVGDHRHLRAALRRASRTGGWLLGR
ncbi:MAG TPA: hypothetical protein VN768_04385 [Acidimicrobiales bacterium]|nr:hypothetical protein [Acidimicrobiales bacterium]